MILEMLLIVTVSINVILLAVIPSCVRTVIREEFRRMFEEE